MVLISLGDTLNGRPPVRPRARAALRPATVLSRMRLRSNSASAAKTWKIRRPDGESVSIFSVSDWTLILRCSRSLLKYSLHSLIEFEIQDARGSPNGYKSLIELSRATDFRPICGPQPFSTSSWSEPFTPEPRAHGCAGVARPRSADEPTEACAAAPSCNRAGPSRTLRSKPKPSGSASTTWSGTT